jgi:exonuclease VII large subunit
MSIDLQDPIAITRSATQAVQRHAADAVDLARSIDLPAPADAVDQARKNANRAAKKLEKRVDHASKRASKRVRAESRRVRAATGNPSRGRKVVVVLLLVAGGAAVVAVLARRMRQVEATQTAPDPFGYAANATSSVHEPDGNAVTTG